MLDSSHESLCVRHGSVSSLSSPASGGDRLQVADRGRFSAFRDAAAENSFAALAPESDSQAGISVGRLSQTVASSTHGKAGFRQRGAVGDQRQRKDLLARRERLDRIREEDQQRARQIIESGKRRRELRFDRLLQELEKDGNVVAEVGSTIRQADQEKLLHHRDVYDSWNLNVSQPITAKVLRNVSLPDHCATQRSAGSKRGCWTESDPTKQSLVKHAQEEAFHREAMAVIHEKRLAATCGPSSSGRTLPSPARSRPVLEPTDWSPARLQGLPCGSFQQAVERGPGARMGRRGGPEAILVPDETDGVATAGKRTVRVSPRSVAHSDPGLLGGTDRGPRGEAALHWARQGASSGAPVQDHYTFEVGARVTDMEFPMGKKLFPTWP